MSDDKAPTDGNQEMHMTDNTDPVEAMSPEDLEVSSVELESMYRRMTPEAKVQFKTVIARMQALVDPCLEAPVGWFLHRAAHQHTGVIYVGDTHTPLPHADGAWLVEFQKYPTGGRLTFALGRTLEEAWTNAAKKVAE